MRNPRELFRRVGTGAARAAAAVLLWVWAKAMRRPVDTFALLSAAAISILIVVNAIFLQTGSRPAPFLANPAPQATTGTARPKTANPIAAATAPASVPLPPAPPSPPRLIPARSDDAIAELIGPSPRILAVQRALSEYGYGQLRLSGMLDNATSAAIAKFEREHKLPITGRVSDRLVADLSAMIGRPVQ